MPHCRGKRPSSAAILKRQHSTAKIGANTHVEQPSSLGSSQKIKPASCKNCHEEKDQRHKLPLTAPLTFKETCAFPSPLVTASTSIECSSHRTSQPPLALMSDVTASMILARVQRRTVQCKMPHCAVVVDGRDHGVCKYLLGTLVSASFDQPFEVVQRISKWLLPSAPSRSHSASLGNSVCVVARTLGTTVVSSRGRASRVRCPSSSWHRLSPRSPERSTTLLIHPSVHALLGALGGCACAISLTIRPTMALVCVMMVKDWSAHTSLCLRRTSRTVCLTRRLSVPHGCSNEVSMCSLQLRFPTRRTFPTSPALIEKGAVNLRIPSPPSSTPIQVEPRKTTITFSSLRLEQSAAVNIILETDTSHYQHYVYANTVWHVLTIQKENK